VDLVKLKQLGGAIGGWVVYFLHVAVWFS
jgi:hypothetical protein